MTKRSFPALHGFRSDGRVCPDWAARLLKGSDLRTAPPARDGVPAAGGWGKRWRFGGTDARPVPVRVATAPRDAAAVKPPRRRPVLPALTFHLGPAAGLKGGLCGA